MAYSLRLYAVDRWVLASSLLSCVFLIFSAVNLALHIRPSADPIFLHYSIFFGIDYIGQWWKLWVIWGLGAGMFLVNFTFSWLLYTRYRIPARFLAIGTILAELCLCIGLYFIVRINS